MEFSTLELARLAGESGRVIAVYTQPRMLDALRRRAARAGVLDRPDARLAAPGSPGLADLAGAVDFTLAFAVAHELPAAAPFFRKAARDAGFTIVESPSVRRSLAALLESTGS